MGEHPDGGTCEPALAWGVDKGTIEGIDVAGRVVALSVHIPGNILAAPGWLPSSLGVAHSGQSGHTGNTVQTGQPSEPAAVHHHH